MNWGKSECVLRYIIRSPGSVAGDLSRCRLHGEFAVFAFT